MKRTNSLNMNTNEIVNGKPCSLTLLLSGHASHAREINFWRNYKRFAVIPIFLFTSFCSGFAQEETTFVKINEAVPSFEFEISPGKTKSISEYKGKTVLITFFATWCGPCRNELPYIQSDIYTKYKKNPNFEILIFGREHSWEEVNKFKNENKFTMPFYPDPQRKIFSKFAGQYIPRNFLISPEGKILFSSIGFDEKDFKSLKSILEKQLKDK